MDEQAVLLEARTYGRFQMCRSPNTGPRYDRILIRIARAAKTSTVSDGHPSRRAKYFTD